MQKLFVTFFGVGLLRPAPGSWGSIAGAIVALPILIFLGVNTLFLVSCLLFLVSVSIINEYEKKCGSHDNSEIVIDEVAGVWIAMSISGSIGEIFSLNFTPIIEGFNGVSWLGIILSVIYFRIFDIWKPSIIGRVDKSVKGGIGVMSDDILAGFFAGIAVLITISLMIKLGASNLIF